MNLLKLGAKPSTSYGLSGRLYLSSSGWLLLSVPNAIVHGVFDGMDEPGIELPVSEEHGNGRLSAHISVMRPAEVDRIGGPDAITERGHTFHYTLGKLKAVTPGGWTEMSKVWMVEIKSPDLEKLRKSYGLSRVPKGGEYEYHITVAARRKNVLRAGDVRKAAYALEMAGVRW